MNFNAYLSYFESIITQTNPPAPFDNPDYLNYAKLNWSRTNRWLKHGTLTKGIKDAVATIQKRQHWIIITEPWCGDAAHVVPFLHMIAEVNPLISVDIELRDSEPLRINDYLTNGGKSIPKLIIQNESGNDLAIWGPRPEACQIIYDKLKNENADFETMKIELQKWYNHDEGKEIMKEVGALISTI
jgi:hypothetical protein